MSSAAETRLEPSDTDIEGSTRRIRDALRQLRLDDMTALAIKQQNERGPIVIASPSWLRQSWLNLKSYFTFLVMTWAQTFRSIFLSSKLDFGDKVSVFVFALGASVVLWLAFLWCLVTTSPPVEWLYSKSILGRQAGNIDWVNSMNPNLYRNLTPQQSTAARSKLGLVPDLNARNPREFDLDVAKLLLQISALMYERSHIDTVLAVQTIQRSLDIHTLSLDSTRQRLEDSADRASNAPGRLYQNVVRHTDQAQADEVQSATQAVRDSDRPEAAAALQPNNSSPPTVNDVVTAADAASRGVIDIWAAEYGVAFEPVSELASLSKAYCSVFWDPKSTWMVVAFKGTDLRWFEEWAVDFTATFFDMSREIPSFHYVHDGFKDRLWPTNVSEGERRPWDTIAASIRLVTAELASIRPPGTMIDVW
ncbi:hypothetical protein FRB90_011050 [Tulasnella sp. 427]|nr:hypothetical protein FRB90_011050 [Tulasnella sp. 427]